MGVCFHIHALYFSERGLQNCTKFRPYKTSGIHPDGREERMDLRPERTHKTWGWVEATGFQNDLRLQFTKALRPDRAQ